MKRLIRPEESGLYRPSDTLKLITYGRKSGLPHIVRLRFVIHNGCILLLAGNKSSDWVLNCLQNRSVKVKIGDVAYEALVEVGPKEVAFELFRKKYGDSVFLNWYKRSQICIQLKLTGAKKFSGGELHTISSYRKWTENTNGYYDSVSDAFDSASEEYDFTIGNNWINTWIRKRSLSLLFSLITPSSMLLDVGCGTGEETLKVANRCRKVVAIDISKRMIEILEKKVRVHGLQNKVSPYVLPASEISKLEGIYGAQSFDIAYSLNGCLNCEPRLDVVSESLAKLIKPDGFFVCSVRNSVCASEMLSHLLTLQISKCTPRKKQPVMVSVGGMDVPAFYYKPNEFASSFRPWFRVKKFFALPAVLPPAYLSDYFVRLGAVGRLAEILDHIFASITPINMLGDQTFFIFQRTSYPND
ncbi:MAG: methyltransferase domain-containing protein [Conexivisphaerales archaeon]